MTPARKRTLLRLAIVLIAGIAVLIWAVAHRSRGIVIENRSGQKVAHLRITVGDETQTFEDVPDGELMSGTFQAGGDALLKVEGQLDNGKRIRLTGKASDDLHFIIPPNGGMMLRPKKNVPR